jgi:hypothetical protein
VQAFLNGVENPVFKNFFTIKTFVAKVIGSSLAVGSSLVMGKEGPMLHAGSILAVILGELLLLPAAGQLQDVTAHQISAYSPCSRQQPAPLGQACWCLVLTCCARGSAHAAAL